MNITPWFNVTGFGAAHVSPKGINKFIKQPQKDIYIPSFQGTISLTEAAQNVTPGKEDSLTYRRIYSNFKSGMAAELCNKEYIDELIRRDLDKLPQAAQHDFIIDTLDCLMNAPKEKLYTSRGANGPIMNSTGCFMLKTCENLILLEASSNRKKDTDFIQALNKDIETSKILIKKINNGNYDILK